MKETETHLPEIQKRSNFTKEQCNVKYDFITECLNIAVFMVKASAYVWNTILNLSFQLCPQKCPKSASTESAECTEAKTFVADCHQDFDAMEKFVENQHKHWWHLIDSSSDKR